MTASSSGLVIMVSVFIIVGIDHANDEVRKLKTMINKGTLSRTKLSTVVLWFWFWLWLFHF